jgi:pyridoxamine 5'-phosphate oxidase
VTDEPGLDETLLDADPVVQFTRWLDAATAAGLPEPNAMVLATVSAAGQPRGRTVLLKAHGAAGFVFYTNRTSRKGSDLAAVPRASLTFPWYALQRQVIIEGTVEELTTEQSEPYFHSRGRGSQLGAWASRQSAVIPSRDVLDERYQRLEDRWAGQEVPMPPFWGGYRVIPHVIEFWQGRVNRMHDRFRYRRNGNNGAGWVLERQAP